MDEYGGYIELEDFSGREYHDKAIPLNSGRSCAEYLFRARKIKKVYLPYFLCNSIKSVCDKLGIQVTYYHINKEWMPEVNFPMEAHEYLYVVNYYGQISNENIYTLSEQYQNIIIDNVQAFFQEPIPGIDTLYSCRKFFGVADGAYLYTDAILDESLELDYSYDRMHFLLGRYEKGASLFYSEYVHNNKSFDDEPIRFMSKLTHNLLRCVDYEKTKQRRNGNFECLHQHFKEINKLNLSIPDGGFMYPLLIANGAEARKTLQKKKIYIPTLWPEVLGICKENDWEYDLAQNILPLPIDQRYTENDMEYIAETVADVIDMSSI